MINYKVQSIAKHSTRQDIGRLSEISCDYLYLLERVGHHGDQHVNEHNDRHHVVGQKEILPHSFREVLHIALADGRELSEPEQ